MLKYFAEQSEFPHIRGVKLVVYVQFTVCFIVQQNVGAVDLFLQTSGAAAYSPVITVFPLEEVTRAVDSIPRHLVYFSLCLQKQRSTQIYRKEECQ